MDIEPQLQPANLKAADTPAEPEHPMVLTGCMVEGDVALMARCMIEEMLQVGVAARRLVAMTRDPNYQALHHARRALGDGAMDALLSSACARVGQHRFKTIEHHGDVQSAKLTISALRDSEA